MTATHYKIEALDYLRRKVARGGIFHYRWG